MLSVEVFIQNNTSCPLQCSIVLLTLSVYSVGGGSRELEKRVYEEFLSWRFTVFGYSKKLTHKLYFNTRRNELRMVLIGINAKLMTVTK